MFRSAHLFAVLAMVSNGLVLAGCSGDDPVDEQQEIIENLVQAGYPAGDIEVVEGLVYVQKDAHVTLEASREMLETFGSDEQYRTTNLVGSAVSKICIVPTSGFVSKARLNAGLDLAIENYNSQPIRLSFARGSAADCTATINIKVGGPTGGSSGFPSGGKPYGSIQIGSGLNNYSLDVNEHVITHEIGHTIGFRHSDYYNRSISCGSGGNEGASTVGAILITGTTPTATRGGSVMNSCFRSSETGEWLGDDTKALGVLY
jgi:hypothetical protein